MASLSERIIQWGTRSEWHKPTVFEVPIAKKNHQLASSSAPLSPLHKVIAEEVLPNVILGLFLLIFYLAYLAMKDEAVEMKKTKEGRPINRSAAGLSRLVIWSL
jgi:hypothetical protein